MESELEMNEGRRDHRTMIASGPQKEMASIGSISQKENRYTRSKKGREDLEFEICVGNGYGLIVYNFEGRGRQ